MTTYRASAGADALTASFEVTVDAWAMIAGLGGHLHATLGGEGCRARSLVFSLDEPRRAVDCVVELPDDIDEIDWEDGEWTEQRLAALAERIPPSTCRLTLSRELLPLVDGGLLDFGEYLGMQRFVWARLATGTERRCTCLRTLGEPRGKRATCLDDARQGLVPL